MTRDKFREMIAQRDAIDAQLRPLLDRANLEANLSRAVDALGHPAAWVEIAINTGGMRAVVQFRPEIDPTGRELLNGFLTRYLLSLRGRWSE